MTAIGQTVLDQLHLPEIDQVVFFKRDEVTTDLICCEVTVGDKAWLFHEEGEGWEVLLAHLAKLPGWRSDWFSAVSQPPFAERRKVAFSR
jgi:hypothetical protein